MPSTGAFITLGAVGAAGAAALMNKRRNSASAEQQVQDKPVDNSPHAMARRRSTVQNDLYEARKQADHFWRRDYGANFSHNSKAKFPMNSNTKLE
ncbi:hypothetical protein BDB00DRAFT_851507 [Zychaea mexicana]|uniref:uncharacterized protein n=1 Tax=Zychaea mexicana TaxID=64656 RepID=UPI0022FDDDA1|nr:uncharacterized protein BDB00DRAFT_851507 [Zychaea mexicana]KAI9485102.1 hypothetical protein BDB00DRAFT_851507 [Zychaea mexicana]